MQAIVIWAYPNTLVPSVIGPYEGDLAFDDANLLRSHCHKVLVCNCTTPEAANKFFALLSSGQ